MTRKDYVALAAAIRAIDNRYRGAGGERERKAIANVVSSLSHTLICDNPAFDADRFAAACGVRS